MGTIFQSKPWLTCVGEDLNGEANPDTQKVLSDFLDDDGETPSQEEIIRGAREGHALESYELKCRAELEVTEQELGTDESVRVRCYRPKGVKQDLPVLLFIHGGCWVFCSLDSHDQICRFYADALHCFVVSVDYSLAPERPFPSGLMDIASVYQSLRAGELEGADPSRVIVGGDSAGGNLSASLCLWLKHEGLPQPQAQLLLYPICDLSKDNRPSHQRYAEDYFFTADTMKWTGACYVKSEVDRLNPLVSPLLAKDLSGLAPVHMVLAECDILRDEGLAYADSLSQAGVDVEVLLYRGVVHAFMAMAGSVELGKEAFRRSVNFLESQFQV